MKIYIFILLLCTASCNSSYHEHFFRENPEFLTSTWVVSGEIFLSDGKIESLPNKKTQGNLIDSLNGAQKRVWIEIYTWTDAAKLTEAVIWAKKRWIDVRVVLEGNVFWTPKINIPVARKLKDAGIPIVYADNNRYSFTHAKFWIIDDSYSISTGNWTASFFTKNREYIYTGYDQWTLDFLETIFLADSSHMGYKNSQAIPPQIVMSPINARWKIEKFILSTDKKITLYVQTLDDDRILALLQGLYDQKKDIEICTADNESNRVRMIEFSHLRWKLIRKPYLHAKVIIVDNAYVFIWSHNLTTNAIENNREMGILLDRRPDFIEQIYADFISDGCR